MKRILICAFILAVPGVACAQANPFADVEAAIIQEDYTKANELARNLVKARLPHEEAARAVYYLGLSHLRLGDYTQAYDAFKKVVNERPSIEIYEKAYIGVIDTLYMQGAYDNALKEAVSLMNKHRNSQIMGLIYLKVARSNLRLARWGQAHEFLQKIIAEYPQSFESRVARQLLEEKQYFTVQVGAFTDKIHADHLTQDLIGRKEYAYTVETTAPNGNLFYRVRVGRMTALKEALALEAKLSALGYPTRIYP